MSKPYPVMQGHRYQHGINIHVAGVASSALQSTANWIGFQLNKDHHGFTKPQSQHSGPTNSATFVDQLEEVLPPVKLIRPIWNLYSFDSDGRFYGNDLLLWKELARRGWKIMLTMFDGPSQRYYYQNHHRGFEGNMLRLRRRQTYAWRCMMESLDREGLLDAIYGYEPLNEPNGYHQAESAGAPMSRSVYHYTESSKAVWDIARSFNSDPILLLAGWRWAASMFPLETVEVPEYGGKSAITHLTEYYPDKVIEASLHHGPNFWGGSDETPEPRKAWEYYSQSNLGKWSDWRNNHNHIQLTEVLGVRNNATNMVPVKEPSQNGSTRNLDAMHYFGMTLWWWPFHNFAKARLIDMNPNGSTVQEFYRHTISAATALYCYPNRPEWFKGEQQGLKDDNSSDTLKILMSDYKNYDRADVEQNFAASQPLPDSTKRLHRYFGGKGTCVITTAPGQFNSVYGGDGKTVVHCSDTSWDIVFLGRGGGVVRTGKAFNIVHTRWGEATVYAGSGHNVIFCFTAETPLPAINALNHETTVVLDPAGTHYVYDLHRANHKISFMGAFANEAELRAAITFIPSSKPDVWTDDMLIALPGGGSARIAYGVDVMDKLIKSVRDFADGWYRAGWVEPADYATPELTAPIVDKGPYFDSLYKWHEGGSPLFNRSGDAFEIFDFRGEPVEMQIGVVA